MNAQTVRNSMLKRAGLFGNTMLGRWITNTVGPHTFVADTLGASALDMLDHQAQTQLGWHAPKGYTEEELAAQAAEKKRINDRIDRGLAEANKRLEAGTGVTQRRQVAQTAPKPPVKTAPRVPSNTEKHMQQYRAKEDQAAATPRGNQLMAQQFARQGMSPYVPQQQIAESQRQTAQDKAMAQKQREIYGKPKRAPGIYNAQGQKWNGSGWANA